MKTRRKPKLKLDPRRQQKLSEIIGKVDPKLQRKVVERIRKLDPKLAAELTKRILPPGPPKPKVTRQFRARLFAWLASQDLKAFAATVYGAAKADNKLFFHYLDKYLRNKPIRFPISEEQRRLLMLLSRNPHIRAKEALKQLGWKEDTAYYGVTKQRAISRSMLMAQAWRDGWLEEWLKNRVSDKE